jgi:glycosyltransferase involved in cell wall biosynthesis
MSPTISIVIATYNATNTLRACLDSIAGQKSDDIEILVIDGASTDGTQNILSEYASVIDYCISEPDRGIYDAWNKGVTQAKGEWVLFIGADDVLEPDAMLTYISFLGKLRIQTFDYICAKNTYIDRSGRPIKVIGEPWVWSKFRSKMNLAHVASLHHISLFKEIGYFNLKFKIAGDYEFLLRKKDKLRCGFIDSCIARMATGGASYTFQALREAHEIRKMHSDRPAVVLLIHHLWQICLFVSHRLLH